MWAKFRTATPPDQMLGAPLLIDTNSVPSSARNRDCVLSGLYGLG